MKATIVVVLVVTVSFFFGGCGTTAKVTRTDGTIVEGTIIGGDNQNVYLDSIGAKVEVDKKRIADIDHPGNGAGVTGAALTDYGILNIAVGASECSDMGAAWCIGVFSPAAVGIGLMFYGFTTWSESTSNVNKPLPTSLHNSYIVPTYAKSDDVSNYGLVLVRQF